LISIIRSFLLDIKDEIINRKFKYKMSAILCSLEQNNLNMTKHKFVSSDLKKNRRQCVELRTVL
jgi:hypothetical protein